MQRLVMLSLTFVAVCQMLEPDSPLGEVGAEMVIRAIDEGGAPIPDLTVTVRTTDGITALGATEPDGSITFVPREPGEHVFRAEPAGGPVLALPLRVLAPPRRWLWALLCVPLGLGLLVSHLRAWSRAREAERAARVADAESAP